MGGGAGTDQRKDLFAPGKRPKALKQPLLSAVKVSSCRRLKKGHSPAAPGGGQGPGCWRKCQAGVESKQIYLKASLKMAEVEPK